MPNAHPVSACLCLSVCITSEFDIIVVNDLGQEKKNFGSGQLIFENWSGAQLKFFFLNHNQYFPNLIFQHKTRDPDSTCIDMSVMAQK